MLFAVVTKDKPNHLDLRMETRPAHVDFLKSSPNLKMAGPFLNADGDMCGSLLVIEADDLQAAQDWAAKDPYALAGLFEIVTVQAWNKVIG
ncbi:MAG: YciI family protein [Pseudomonadota bacterium]